MLLAAWPDTSSPVWRPAQRKRPFASSASRWSSPSERATGVAGFVGELHAADRHEADGEAVHAVADVGLGAVGAEHVASEVVVARARADSLVVPEILKLPHRFASRIRKAILDPCRHKDGHRSLQWDVAWHQPLAMSARKAFATSADDAQPTRRVKQTLCGNVTPMLTP